MSLWPRTLFGITLGVLAALAMGNVSARDNGQYADAPLHDWFSSLRNANGGLCCEEADGHRLEDVDWRGEADGTYSVRIEGQWVKLQPDQIVKGPNKLGQAVVWIWNGMITCFMPGAMG